MSDNIQTTLISYNADSTFRKEIETFDEIDLVEKGQIQWYNTYGFENRAKFHKVFRNNKLDSFFYRMLNEENNGNLLISIGAMVYVDIQVLKTEDDELDKERIIFIASEDFVWSIQEKEGDYFDPIRTKISRGTGIVRMNEGDYLLYLMLMAIVDNYHATYRDFGDYNEEDSDMKEFKPTPSFMAKIEKRKGDLNEFKRSALSLRDFFTRLEKTNIPNFTTVYFSDLKEQVGNLLSDIDFEINALDSKINMVFTIQGHRLNEVMKTLTLFSVIFIPLTFICGLYGMNFDNIPETKWQNGYFYALIFMFVLAMILLVYFKRKKWF